jgi:hypothetical protein
MSSAACTLTFNGSAVHYLGYAADNESPEAIMRKFQALERFESELSARNPLHKSGKWGNHISVGQSGYALDDMENDPAFEQQKESAPVRNVQLDERDLMELARRTSATDRSIVLPFATSHNYYDQLMYREDYSIRDYEASYRHYPHGHDANISRQRQIVSDDDDLFDVNEQEDHNGDSASESDLDEDELELELYDRRPSQKRRASKPKTSVNRVSAANVSTATKLAHSGQRSRPKAYQPRVVDLNAPTLVKHPPGPMPSTWAHIVSNPFLVPEQSDLCNAVHVQSILGKAEKWMSRLGGAKVQGICMRPPLSLPVDTWTLQLAPLLPRLMPHGYLFVWLNDRSQLAPVIRAADRHLAFKYVENLCWVWREQSGRIREQPASLLGKSKMTLLILKRDPDNRVKLRHQRHGDCLFDVARLPEEQSRGSLHLRNGACSVPTHTPDARVYDIIETLIDPGKARPHESRGEDADDNVDGVSGYAPYLLHLWAGDSEEEMLIHRQRRHWLRVIESDAAE